MIRVVLIDDEQPALEMFEYSLSNYDNIEIVSMFQDVQTALKKIPEIKPDVVFLDIDMPEMNGLQLALKIKEMDSRIIIIFVTAYSEYALEAFKAYPLDYIMKPVSQKRLTQTMEQLMNRLQLQSTYNDNKSPQTVIKCFENFEIFTKNSENTLMKFATRQTKELLAFLICHFEKQVTRWELITNIFGGVEDKKTINLLHVTAYSLRRAMEDAGIISDSIMISGKYMLKAKEGVCDYIDFSKFITRNPYINEENITEAENIAKLYQGTFLKNEDYIWAEEVRTELELQYEKLMLKMAEYYMEIGNYQKCEKVLLTLHNYDPLFEEGNVQLLELYMKTGKKEKYKIQYLEYKKILKEEFQSKPDNKYNIYFKCNVN